MIKKISFVLVVVLTCLLIFCGTAFASSTTTVSELMEVLQEDKYSACYDMELNAPYGKESSGINENINPETGEVIVNKNIVSIPGVNGKDIELSLKYRSRDAKLYEETTKSGNTDNSYGSTIIAYYDVFNGDGYWIKTGALKYTTSEATILGETTIDGDKWVFNGYLQYASGSSIKKSNNIKNAIREMSALSAGKYIFGVGWSLDIPLLEVDGDNVYVSLRDGRTYKADFSSGAGLKDYELYNVVFKKDKSYKYASDQSAYRLYYSSGDAQYFSENGELLFDEDRYGNYVRYRWVNEDGMRLLKSIEDSAGHIVEIEYSTKSVIVKNGMLTYCLEKESIQDHSDKYYLYQIIDSEGRKIQFNYDFKQAGFDQIGKSKKSNTYANLASINYPTGGKTEYSYIKSEKNIGSNGSMEYFKVDIRKDIDSGEERNVLEYEYFKEPDGYPNYNPSELPDGYRYYTEVIDSLGMKTVYWYNSDHNSYFSEVYTDRLMASTRREFDSRNNMPIKVTERAYNSNGQYTEQIDSYKFNYRGNMVQENHIYEGENLDSTNHQIIYAFDEKYDILLSKSYKQDEDTEISIVNDLTEDGMSIANTKVLADGELLQAKYYVYDLYGNIIEKKTEIGEDAYDVVQYEYAPEYGYAYRTSTTYRDVLDAFGKTSDVSTSSEYEFATGLPVSYTDANGNKTSYEYDTLGRVTKEILADGNYRSFIYDDERNTIKAVDANKDSLLYLYSELGNLSEVRIPVENSRLVKLYYDELDNPIRKEDSSGNYRLISYDQSGRLVSTEDYDSTDTLLAKSSIAYDEVYELDNHVYQRIKVTNKGDAGNRITTYYFDQQGRLHYQGMFFDGVEKLEEFEYDYAGNNLSVTDLLGNSTEVEYDGLGRPVVLTDAMGYKTLSSYDLSGNLVSETNAIGEAVNYQYDQLGRQIEVDMPFDGLDRSTQKSFYDGNGNLVRTIDPEGNETKYYYNERSLLSAVESITGLDSSEITRYEYDAEGRVIRTERGLSSWDDTDFMLRTYEYDQFGNIIKETDPAGNSKEYVYDGNGNLVLETDRNGVSIQYTYDGLNRLVEKENSLDGEPGKVRFDYDLLGNTILVGNRAEEIMYQFDENGRVILQESDFGISQQYSYDVLGRPTEFTVKQGNLTQMELGYDYDKNGNLTRLNAADGQYTYSYDPAGRLIKEQNGINGIESTYSYYASGNLASLNHTLGDDAIESYLYEYDRIGNRTRETEGFEITEYSYDSLSRLEMAKMPNGTVQHYAFDDLGNIESLTEMIETSNGSHMIFENLYTYDECNRLLLKKTTRGEEISFLRFSYDLEGNQVQKDEVFQGIYGTIATLTDEFRYNGYNQLVGVEDSAGINTFYKYNGQNLRTSKQGSGVTANFIYDVKANIIVEMDGRTAVTALNTRGFKLLSRETGGSEFYYLHNAHGDVTKLTDGFGRIVEDYTYDPYGNAVDNPDYQMQSIIPELTMSQMVNPIDNPFRYAGEYLDVETGNYYLRARYYDPTTQRFTSEDSYRGELVAPLSLNRYSYCMGNPVTFIDPSGNESTEELLMQKVYNGGEITQEDLDNLEEYDENARVAATVGVGFVPVVGDVKDGIDLIAGKDIITGEEVNRAVLFACLLSTSEAGDLAIRHGKKALGAADEVAGGIAKTLDSSADDLVDLTDFRSDHILNRHRNGSGLPGKTEFPADWSDEKILHNISDVATDPKSSIGVGKWDSPYAIGTRDGVDIRVDFYPPTHNSYNGMISTGYPINIPTNPR